MKRIDTIGLEYSEQISDVVGEKCTQDNNPQLILVALKKAMAHIFREKEKILIPKLEKEIITLREELKTKLNDPLCDKEERKAGSASIQEKIHSTEKICFQKVRDNSAARNRLEGETTTTKYWTSVNKENKLISK